MPRDGSLTLSDIREPTLAIGCERCGRHGRYNVAAHGADMRLPDLLANCRKARSARSASTIAAKPSSRALASELEA
jgi:hypothetical protein